MSGMNGDSKMADHAAAWNHHYVTDPEKVGSGYGSLPASAISYRKTVEQFIRTNRVHSVLDIGCGDWQFQSLFRGRSTMCPIPELTFLR